MNRPLANSYWLVPGRLLAGEYPPGREAAMTDTGRVRIQELIASGISCFIDLTEEGECPAYEFLLPPTVSYFRRAIRDQKVPRRSTQMRRIQDEIASALAAGRTIYVHCRAGIGRTGTVAGCFLVEQGRDGDGALRELNALWTAQCARAATWPEIPQTTEQAEYIRHWSPRRARAEPARDDWTATIEISDAELSPVKYLRERFLGALLGLAVGDALAAATQFRKPGSFTAVGDLLGGGPFDLPRGGWSDDTAMTLCLAESFAEREEFDAHDQVVRYSRWQREGYLSATGQCLGITASTARALATAHWRRQPFAGSHDPTQLDAEPLSRVAAVVLQAYSAPSQAVAWAEDAARVTCQAPLVLDACRLLAAMLHAALSGAARAQVLAPRAEIFGGRPLKAQIAAIGAQSFKTGYLPPSADGGAPVLLELARWCLASTGSFREGALRAANLGGHSDVVCAVYGQLAGAHYGVAAIPTGWRQALLQPELIEHLADRLLRNVLVHMGESAQVL